MSKPAKDEATGALSSTTAGSLVHRAAEALRAMLDSGAYPPGSRLPTHPDLCKMVGVSHVTLQRALQVIRRDGRIVRHRGRGTFVCEADPVRSAGLIGVLTRAWFDPNLSGWDFACARAVVEVMGERGEDFHFYPNQPLTNSADSNAQQVDPHLMQDIESGGVRGLLVLGEISRSHAAAYRRMRQFALPVVETSWNARPTSQRAVVDYPRMASEAVAHAEQAGCTTFGWLATRQAENDPEQDPILYALRSAVETSGLSTRRQWQRWIRPRHRSGYEGFLELWNQRKHPDALMVTDDVAAAGAAYAIEELGIDVPDELLVIAPYNVGVPTLHSLPFCRIGVDALAVVREAARLLDEAIRDPGVPPRRVLVAPRPVEPAGRPAEGADRAVKARAESR